MKQTKEDKKVQEYVAILISVLKNEEILEKDFAWFKNTLQEAIQAERQRLLEGLEEMRREDGELNEAGECVCCGDGGGWMPCVNAEVNTCLDQVKELITKQQ